MTTIVTTWSGEGGFTAKHVQALAKQVDEHAPFTRFVCITNHHVPGVMCWRPRHNWPGWWVKFEAFDPMIQGDILYMDIDTVIVGPLDDILRVNKLTLLRDFYRDGKRLKEGLQASLMMLPEADRAAPWERFIQDPQAFMAQNRVKGDQPMLEQCYMGRAQKWQDILPGQLVSWKVDCNGACFSPSSIPPEARVIIFHGQPRPWQCKEFEDLYK